VLVVAGHDRLRALGDQLDAGQRVGAVAHGVAQAEHGVGLARGVGEDGAQRLEVAVHVRQDGVFQGALPPTRRPIDALSGSDPGGR
jgi:hypothetical protein